MILNGLPWSERSKSEGWCLAYIILSLLQPPKLEKHGSGTDSDYDNTQTYDTSTGWVKSVFQMQIFTSL